MADFVLIEKSQGVAILMMNRPDQLNAMSAQLSAELHDAVARMAADDEVGCIVITGAGNKAFS
ncbi:MAG: enoyl-CoA hydratase/isomerase family protein, partial [Candidatus Rokuibacteriota bacterium]